jgi:hypothetical protein
MLPLPWLLHAGGFNSWRKCERAGVKSGRLPLLLCSCAHTQYTCVHDGGARLHKTLLQGALAACMLETARERGRRRVNEPRACTHIGARMHAQNRGAKLARAWVPMPLLGRLRRPPAAPRRRAARRTL